MDLPYVCHLTLNLNNICDDPNGSCIGKGCILWCSWLRPAGFQLVLWWHTS